MKRSNVNVGTVAEILADLDQSGRDRHAQGKTALAHEYAAAMNAIEQGAEFVRVRHSVWCVAADGSLPDGEIAAAVLDTDAVPAG